MVHQGLSLWIDILIYFFPSKREWKSIELLTMRYFQRFFAVSNERIHSPTLH